MDSDVESEIDEDGDNNGHDNNCDDEATRMRYDDTTKRIEAGRKDER